MSIRIIILLLFMKSCFCDNQTVFTLNGKKSMHVVSDRFLSISVDPAVLLSGLNISGASLLLAVNLKPAYVRVAGPSTEFLQFIEQKENFTYQISDETLSLTVTPSQWASLNAWFTNTKLTPVFAINDRDGLNGKFDPKTIFSLLDLANKINVSCFWQLGYDSSSKQVNKYLQEVKTLRNILNVIPSKTWKIVGSDVSSLQYQQSFENVNQVFQALRGVVHSVMWEGKQDEDSFPEDDEMTKLLSASIKPALSVWTTAPKNKRAVSFVSGILWAKQIGEAANKGFTVVFRQPRLYEFFTDTPVYWVTVLHKKLMGINVLDVKTSGILNVGINVYAHCTRRQNHFSRRGAATIFVVNNASVECTVALKILGATQLKAIEVQVYSLTSDDPNSTDTYLNDDKLTRSMLQDDHFTFTPKIRRAKINKYLSFDVPSNSVNFFVLPDARVQTCINSEDETNLLIEEIHADQRIDFPSDLPTNILTRFREEEDDPPVTLTQLYSEMQKELEADEKYYNGVSKYVKQQYKWSHQNLEDDLVETTLVVDGKNNANTNGSIQTIESNVGDKIRNEITEKKNAFFRKLNENSKLFRKDPTRASNIMLKPNREKILNNVKDNINTKSEESDEIILPAAKIIKGESFGMPKYKRDCKGGGRGGHGRGGGSRGHSKQTSPTPKPTPKHKRAINMDLLRQKTDDVDMLGKFKIRPNNQDSHEIDFTEEIKKQHEKTKSDLEKLLHPEKPKNEQKSFNSAKKTKKEKVDVDMKKQYDKMKLDLEKILHPESDKKEQNLQTRVIDSEDDYFDVSNSFNSLGEDDMNSNEKIDKEFKLGIPWRQNTKKKSREERFQIGRNGKLQNDLNTFLGKELVVDSKDPHVVEKAIKDLEDYFNKPKILKYESDDDLSSEYDYNDMDDFNYHKPSLRFKRDDKHYTEADVRYYKQLMNHNIKHMRDSMRKQQRENLKLRKTSSPIQRIKPKYIKTGKAPGSVFSPKLLKVRTNADHVKSPGAYDLNYSNGTTNIENKKADNSVKYLKNKLAHHKKIEDVQGGIRLRNAGPEVNDETQRLLNLIKSELRKRKPRSASCARVYEPKVDSLRDSLDSKNEEKKKSDKDIMKLRKIRPFQVISDSQNAIPVVNGGLKKVRIKRVIDINGNCAENSFSDEEKNYKNIFTSKVVNGKNVEVQAEDSFCDINDVSIVSNATIDFHTESIESKNKSKDKNMNYKFVDDVFLFFSKFFNELFTGA